MRPTIRNFRAPANLAFGLFVLCLLLAALPAAAQTITVTSAVPDMAEQETYGLVVRVSGNNFGADAQVDFLVTGTADPGGITVRSVKRRNPKTLDVTIDVAPDAQTQLKFDIQVRSGGRTGKGTELFKVLAKPTGNDTIPPGDVTDLDVDLAAGGIGYRSVALFWTAPADDAYEASSGPVYGFSIRGSADGELTLENWGDLGVDTTPPAAPGTEQRYRIDDLVPDTTYWFAVRNRDDAQGDWTGGNWSGVSNNLEVTTEPFPPVDWVIDTVDSCPPETPGSLASEDFEYDLEGRPAILYVKHCGDYMAPYVPILARWTGSAWTHEVLPAPITAGDRLAFDPSGAAVIASSNKGVDDRRISGTLMLYRQVGSTWQTETIDTKLAGGPPHLAFEFHDGRPYIAYPVELKGGRRAVRLAEWTGSSWLRHELPATPLGNNLHQLAFDLEGHPAIPYVEYGDRTLRVALWNGAAWEIEVVDAAEAGQNCSPWPSLVWNPVRGSLTAANHCDPPGPVRLRVCDQLLTGWTCSTVVEDAGEPSLAFDAEGRLLLSVYREGMPQLMTSMDGGVSWSEPELVDWSTCGATLLRIDRYSRPSLVYMVGGLPNPGELHFAHRP